MFRLFNLNKKRSDAMSKVEDYDTDFRLKEIEELLRKQAHENRMLEEELASLKKQLKSVEQDIINLKYDDNH
jgi:DNA-binding transcriptional MerR regulator